MTGIDELRAEVAAGRGLPAEAGRLLTGTSLVELEASADQLVALVEAHQVEREEELHEGGAPATLGELVANAPAEKLRRQRALIASLHGRGGSEQPRDEHGRYASFDGGARGMPVRARSPEAEHDALLAELIAAGRVHRPASF